MPDQFGFDHLPHWGQMYHRCIECEWPGWGVMLTESQRRRHHRDHTLPAAKQRQREIQKQRLRNLAKARRARANREGME